MEIEKLKSLLQCPVCMDIASHPIYNCPNGHIICRHCAPKLRICPVCRTPVIQGSRNIVAEQLASECEFPCRYSTHGCDSVAKGNQIAQHEATCDFRPLKCAVRLCKEVSISTYLQFYEHLCLTHGIPVAPHNQSIWERELPMGNVSFIKDSAKKPGGMTCSGERFLQFLDSDDHNVWIWASFCGPNFEDRAPSFEVTLKIRAPMKNLEMSWTGPIHNIRENSRDVYASGLCLITNKICLKRFVEEKSVGDACWKLQITIRSVNRIEFSIVGKRKKKGRNEFGKRDEKDTGDRKTAGEKLMNFFACGT